METSMFFESICLLITFLFRIIARISLECFLKHPMFLVGSRVSQPRWRGPFITSTELWEELADHPPLCQGRVCADEEVLRRALPSLASFKPQGDDR